MSLQSPEVQRAEALLAEWDDDKGLTKAAIETREWGDKHSHGRRFDRFIRTTLGIDTSTKRVTTTPKRSAWEVSLQESRGAMLQALRIWNDPVASHRASSFATFFVTAWDRYCEALLLRRRTDDPASLEPRLAAAFCDSIYEGLRSNVLFWRAIRDAITATHSRATDAVLIPYAQAGLINFEAALATDFGDDFLLGAALSAPMPLAGFREPTALRHPREPMPAAVLEVVKNPAFATPSLLSDPTFRFSVAYVPIVNASVDAAAFFVRPADVTDELADTVEHLVVSARVPRMKRPNLAANEVVERVGARIPFRFSTRAHTAATYALGLREKAEQQSSASYTDTRYCEWVSAVKRYLYNELWVERLVAELQDADRFKQLTGFEAKPAVKPAPVIDLDPPADSTWVRPALSHADDGCDQVGGTHGSG